MTEPTWAYNDGGGEEPLSLEWDPDPDLAAGLGVGWDADDNPIIQPLNLGEITDPQDPQTPLSPALSGNMPTRTTVHLAWVAADNTGRPPITSWQAEVRSSTDNGASFSAFAPITGSPFAAGVASADLAGLSVGTPEIIREYRVRGVNADGVGQWSNVQPLQWNVVVPQRPTAPTNFRDLGAQANTTHDVAWDATVATDVDKYGIFVGQATALDPVNPLLDNIDPGLLAVTLTGLTAGSTLSNVNVRRHNAQGWSPASNRITLVQPTEPPPVSLMMTGVSDSAENSGGTLVWDGWRAYTKSKMQTIAARTGANRPKFICYSINGSPLGSGDQGDPLNGNRTYNAIFDFVKGELDEFYYNGAGQTRSSRWGIRLYWSTGGNENSDKGYLATQSAANASTYATMMRASQDAAHMIDPVTGNRRYPDAYVGSNPTQEHERTGIVAWWLHPSAQYHDFVVWSMYPPGRGVNDTSLSRNPRIDWPFTSVADESKRNNIQQGFLLRCFYRTKQAEAQARIDLGDPSFHLIIACGETGQASDPDNRGIRPYYAVHGLIGSMFVLATAYALGMDFACWWDNKTAETKPHNALSDEPPISDHLDQGGGGAAGNNATATNPSTREAWQNWRDFDHRRGGTHPAQWAGFPGTIPNFATTTGTPI